MEKEREINLDQVCEFLGKSKRTITLYIKAGKLRLEKVKAQKGIEYRFSQSEIEGLKKPETIGQTTEQNEKIEKKDDDTLSLLKDTMKLLQKQLKSKDTQIKNLLERQREVNILIGQLQIMRIGW